MHVSSPDVFASQLRCKEFIDIDLLENPNCSATRDYANEIFAYLRGAEVKDYHYICG